MGVLLVLGCVAVALAFFVATRKPVATGYIYYDPNEELPAPPQPWGRDDYQPWPGVMDTHDGWDIEDEIEIVTSLWNEATNDGDTILAAALMDDYESLCRIRGQII